MFARNVEKFQTQTHLPVAQAEINVFKVEVIERIREESITPRQLGADREDRAIDEIKLLSRLLNRDAAAVLAQFRGALGEANQSGVALAKSVDENLQLILCQDADIAIYYEEKVGLA